MDMQLIEGLRRRIASDDAKPGKHGFTKIDVVHALKAYDHSINERQLLRHSISRANTRIVILTGERASLKAELDALKKRYQTETHDLEAEIEKLTLSRCGPELPRPKRKQQGKVTKERCSQCKFGASALLLVFCHRFPLTTPHIWFHGCGEWRRKG